MAEFRSMTELELVKENFLSLGRRGWFLPESDTHTLTCPCNKKYISGYRKAAVLCLIGYRDNHFQVLLTKRSENISFGGHECFPGGVMDDSDTSIIATALREAEEEINLDRRKVEVVCPIPPISMPRLVSGLTTVTGVIALLKCPIEELNLTPNWSEVDSLHWVPLETFLDHQDQDRTGGERTNDTMSFHYVDPVTKRTHHIWGFTGYIAVLMSAIALNRAPSYFYRPYCLSKLVKEGDVMLATSSRIALTQGEVESMPLNKL